MYIDVSLNYTYNSRVLKNELNIMDHQALADRREALRHRTFLMMIHILVIFGVPAIGSFFLGRYLDAQFDMRPYGSLIAIALALVISWLITIRAYKSITQAFRQLERDEDEAGVVHEVFEDDDEDSNSDL